MGEYLKRKVQQVSKFHPEIEIIKVNTDIDHMISIPLKMSGYGFFLSIGTLCVFPALISCFLMLFESDNLRLRLLLAVYRLVIREQVLIN